MKRSRRQAYGQHFLRDARVIGAIVDEAARLADELGCDRILEIGPGQGALTEPLMERLGGAGEARVSRVVVVEKDNLLALKLRERWPAAPAGRAQRGPSVSVVNADFLDVPDADWAQGRLLVVSNLPYSAGTAILLKLIEHPAAVRGLVLMFQQEVARKLLATPGERDAGSLTVWVANRWEVESLIVAPPEAFAPPPKVHSEVVVLRPRSAPQVAGSVEGVQDWQSLLDDAFRHRRKMLRAGLRGTRWQKALDASGVDGTKRAESLTWGEWERLLRAAPASRE